MSFNFNDFDDYSSWSWFWKTFTDFLVRLEKIETKESLEKRINQIIIDLDKAVWGAYRKYNTHEINYSSKDYQLAYLMRYYPLYQETVKEINDKFSGSLLKLNNKKKLHISIFGAGSAPEQFAISKLLSKEIEDSNEEIKLYFRLFDKFSWEIGRRFTNAACLKQFREKKIENKVKMFISDKKKYQFESFNSKSLEEKQDLIIFQFCINEITSLIGEDETLKKIEELSSYLSINGKIVFIERDHISTPRNLLKKINDLNTLKEVFNGREEEKVQRKEEIPKFISQAYDEINQIPSLNNRYIFNVFQNNDFQIKGSFFKIEEYFPQYKHCFDFDGRFVDWERCRQLNLAHGKLANYGLPIAYEEVEMVKRLNESHSLDELENFFQRGSDRIEKMVLGKIKTSDISFMGSKSKFRSESLLNKLKVHGTDA